MNFVEAMKLDRDELEIECGIYEGFIHEHGDTFEFHYEVRGNHYWYDYPSTDEGLADAVWEWLCTLSRATSPIDSLSLNYNRRTLGSRRLVEVA